MFIYSIKTSKLKIAIVVLVILALVLLALYIPSNSQPVNKTLETSLNAGSNAERIAFLQSFGYDVLEDPIEVKEVIIPSEFDDVYEEYNDLQVEQGFDLKDFQGVRVKEWTYAVKNYNGQSNSHNTVRAHLLVYNDKIIGGDISSVDLEGFMHGFQYTQTEPETTDTTAPQSDTTLPEAA